MMHLILTLYAQLCIGIEIIKRDPNLKVWLISGKCRLVSMHFSLSGCQKTRLKKRWVSMLLQFPGGKLAAFPNSAIVRKDCNFGE